MKKDPKPKVVSSDGDLMNQLHDTLERRRSGISGEKKSAKSKKVVKQAPKLTEEEIARKKAENLAKAATIREANKKKWEEAAKKNEEIARERRRVEAEEVKARIEQKRRERGETTENVVNGIDPAFHHNIVSDLRSEIASLREQLKNQGGNNLADTLGGGSGEPIYSKPLDAISIASSSTQYSEPWQDPDTLIGEEEEKALKILDEVLDDSSGYSSGCSRASSSLSDWSDALSFSSNDGYDTVYTSSDSDYEESSRGDNDIPLPPLSTEEELAEIGTIIDRDDLTEPAELSTHLKVSNPDEAEATNTAIDLDNAALDIAKDVESDNVAITEQHVATTQTTSLDQEILLKKAEALSYISHEELRVARKVASNHIKHRMFERSMLFAVAAGDENESDQSQILGYSVWSSGAFGTAKQKASNNTNGYSSKILGGSIGADVQCENDLLLGASFSKIRSNIKYVNQSASKKLNTYIASIYGTSLLKENLALGVIGSAGVSSKQRSKLLSFESHLDYQIALPQEIKLIPNIGLKYDIMLIY